MVVVLNQVQTRTKPLGTRTAVPVPSFDIAEPIHKSWLSFLKFWQGPDQSGPQQH